MDFPKRPSPLNRARGSSLSSLLAGARLHDEVDLSNREPNYPPPIIDLFREKDLPGDEEFRHFTSGQPPNPPGMALARQHLKNARRSTLSNVSELDHALASKKTTYKDSIVFPLSRRVLRILTPFVNGSMPIANTQVFQKLLLDQDINNAEVETIKATLDQIGPHCADLVILSPIYGSKHGDVFLRRHSETAPVNDWLTIIKSMPSLEAVTIDHAQDQPAQFLRYSLLSLHRAIADVTELESLKSITLNVPAAVFLKFVANLASVVMGSSSWTGFTHVNVTVTLGRDENDEEIIHEAQRRKNLELAIFQYLAHFCTSLESLEFTYVAGADHIQLLNPLLADPESSSSKWSKLKTLRLLGTYTDEKDAAGSIHQLVKVAPALETVWVLADDEDHANLTTYKGKKWVNLLAE